MNVVLKPRKFSLNIKGNLYDLSEPKIMGILNMTPDSFSDGGKFNSEYQALKHAAQMVKGGVDIIDIGPQSTRPGSELLPASEEIKRIGKIIRKIKTEFPETLISLDTFYAETVRFGVDEGIDIINDISAGQFDPEMLETVAESGLPYILMHVNSTYAEMHRKNEFEDILLSVNEFLLKKSAQLLDMGIHDIILDPGFGFGKTVEDQLRLLEDTAHIGLGNFPVLIGISRKSFIYKPLGKSANEVGAEMAALHTKILENGAKILRVHDVAEARVLVDEFVANR